MGMSTYVLAYKSEANEQHLKYTEIKKICEAANVSLPDEVFDYFKELKYKEDALQIDLRENVHYVKYKADMREGIEINLKDLPNEVVKIRFINSY